MMNIRSIILSVVVAATYPNIGHAQLTRADFPGDICGFVIGSTLETVSSVCADGVYNGNDKYVCHRLRDELDFEADIIVTFSESNTIDSVSIVTPRFENVSDVFYLYRALFRQYVGEFGEPSFDEENNDLIWTFGDYGHVNLGLSLQDMSRGNLHLEFVWRRN